MVLYPAAMRMTLAVLVAGLCHYVLAAETTEPAQTVETATPIVTAPPLPLESVASSPKAIQKLAGEGKLQEALSAANQYLDVNSQDGTVLFLKAQILTKMGKTDEAISVLEGMTERFPEMAAPYNNLAVLYAGKGRLDEARKVLETALMVQPNYATAYENLADLYLALARQSYAHALKLDPNNKTLKAKADKLN
jgi:Flp pilus assembly protein TadD